MISDVRADYIEAAQNLGDYQKLTLNYLMDNYCAYMDAGDAVESTKYLAAIMLRFWSKIGKMYMQQPTNLGLEMEDFHDWLYEAVEYARKYKAWQDTSKHVNAEQAINKCLETIKLQHLYQYRLDKHKINYCGNYSLDQPVGDPDNDEATLIDTVESEDNDIKSFLGDAAVTEIIQKYINSKKIVEAIILSCIAYKPCEREIKEVSYFTDETGKKKRCSVKATEFWPYKLVRTLNALPESYDSAFCRAFTVKESEFKAAIQAIRSANNQKLYKYIRATLASAKKDFAY